MRNTTKTNATNENSKLESKNSSCKFYSFKCLKAKQKLFQKNKNPTMTQNNKKNEDPQTPNFPKFVQKSQKRNNYTQEQRGRLSFNDDEEDKTKNYTIRIQYCTKGNRRLIHYAVDTKHVYVSF